MSASSAHFAGVLPDGLVAAIDRDGEIPIGVQLAWALRSCIRDGRFSPAQRLPGLRELADAVGVNANTVRAVYQRLEREGLIDSRQGSGTFVAAQPLAAASSTVSAIAADAAREALAAGADPREVAAALYVAPARDVSAQAKRDARKADANEQAAAGLTHRQELRAQIATLERAIGAMEAEHPGVAPQPEDATSGRGGPALLSAEELEHVRSGLVRRLAAVQAAIDERATTAEARARTTTKVTANATANATAAGTTGSAATTAAANATTTSSAATAAKATKRAAKPAKPKRPRAPAITPPRTAPC